MQVAGIVEAIGDEAPEKAMISVGDKVVVYPFEGVPHGYAFFIVEVIAIWRLIKHELKFVFRYAEYMTVPDLQYLVKVPDSMPLSVAAMLPTGALWAMNTVHSAKEYILKRLEEKGESGKIGFIKS